jgi:signal transduction histidine kinase/DNA-binding response OmpR family regulator
MVESDHKSQDPVCVLVVDDLPEKRLALQVALDGLEVDIIQAASGREALRHLLHRDFAVILLDVNMPDIDGFEAAALIRQRPRTEHTPIIFITGYDDELRAIQGYNLGAVDYILSPVLPTVLRTKVGVFVDLFRKTEQIKRQAQHEVALAREQAARAAAEEANRRSAFLAEAATVLAHSLDINDTVRGLLRLSAPRIADLVGVTLAENQGLPPWPIHLAWARDDGTLAESPDNPPGSHSAVSGADALHTAVERVRSTGRSELLTGSAARALVTCKSDEPGPSLHAALLLPLIARGRTLGVLVLGQGNSGRVFAEADQTLAEDLAARAAVAFDNARLYRTIQEADRRKDEFLAMLAHELRNPLAPIRNWLEILKRIETDPKVSEQACMVIDRQVTQVIRLVDDLLDVSRITLGKITLRFTRTEARSVVAAAVETSRPLIDASDHALEVELPEHELWIECDSTRLAQILANLLNNAAKYTTSGGRISLRVSREADQVVFRVRDNGQGIPRPMILRVFEPFTQIDQTLARSQGGLGIGLTLVKRLVELHGGSVEGRSDGPGRGSEFTVRLPLAAEPGDESSVEVPAPKDLPVLGTASPARAFLVDDNADAASSLAMLLRLHGHQVEIFHDGPAGLAAFDEAVAAGRAPDVVFLDIGLPGLDGYAVARALRSRHPGVTFLLVAVTGYGQDEDRRLTREAGFNYHLVKPLDLDELIELMASVGATASA